MVIQIADVIFDIKQRVLKKDNTERHLEPKVFDLLSTLVLANGDIVSREQLIIDVWQERVVGEGAINRTVSLLRAHFKALSSSQFVVTVPTQGYRLAAQVVDVSLDQALDLKDNDLADVQSVSHVTHQTIDAQSVSSLFSLKLIIRMCAIVIVGGLLFGDKLWDTFVKVTPASLDDELTLMSSPLIGLTGWEYKLSTTEKGDEILFHHIDNNKQSVYLYNIQTHVKRKVLSNALAVISSDGRKIAYVIDDNQCSFMLYDVATKNSTHLFNCNEPPTILAWGDGITFYYNQRFSKSDPYQIFNYNTDTSRLRQITNPTSNNNTRGDFRFSYNQRNNQLAVIRYVSESASKIIIYKNDLVLSTHLVDKRLTNIVWHPSDDSLIAADQHNLYALLASTGEYSVLKTLAYNIDSLANARAQGGISLLISSSQVSSEVLKFDRKTLEHTIWQQSARVELLPRIKADTQLVLSTRFKSHHWWRIKNDEASLVDVKLPFDLKFVRYELSSDGQQVLFSKHGLIYELDLQRLSYRLLFEAPNKSYVVNYDDSNEKNIIYSSNHLGQWQLWLFNKASNQHQQLTQRGGYSGRVVGEFLYYSKFAVDGLWRKKIENLASPQEQETLIIRDFNRINWLNWRIVDDDLYFYREKTGLWTFNIMSNEEHLVMAKPDGFVHQYTIAPDDHDIFWVRVKPVQGDIYQYSVMTK